MAIVPGYSCFPFRLTAERTLSGKAPRGVLRERERARESGRKGAWKAQGCWGPYSSLHVCVTGLSLSFECVCAVSYMEHKLLLQCGCVTFETRFFGVALYARWTIWFLGWVYMMMILSEWLWVCVCVGVFVCGWVNVLMFFFSYIAYITLSLNGGFCLCEFRLQFLFAFLFVTSWTAQKRRSMN